MSRLSISAARNLLTTSNSRDLLSSAEEAHPDVTITKNPLSELSANDFSTHVALAHELERPAPSIATQAGIGVLDSTQAPNLAGLLTTVPFASLNQESSPSASVTKVDLRKFCAQPFDQAKCGCCWSCGSTGALTDMIAYRGGIANPELSPLLILTRCFNDATSPDSVSEPVYGCCGASSSSGGLACLSVYGAASGNGAQDLSKAIAANACDVSDTDTCVDAERSCGDGNWCCGDNPILNISAKSTQPAWRVKRGSIVALTDAATMKFMLKTRGPLVANMIVYDDLYNLKDKVYMRTSTASDGAHCVEVVGFDDDLEFKTPRGKYVKGAWLIKNSWGRKWGPLQGYFYVAYNSVWSENQDIRIEWNYTRNKGGVKKQGVDLLGGSLSFDFESWPRGLKEPEPKIIKSIVKPTRVSRGSRNAGEDESVRFAKTLVISVTISLFIISVIVGVFCMRK